MIRRPPRSTLFPYTTSSDLDLGLFLLLGVLEALHGVRAEGDFVRGERSEEHTSELQSHVNLVCRLLLEKKKPHKPPRDSTTLTLAFRPASVHYSIVQLSMC